MSEASKTTRVNVRGLPEDLRSDFEDLAKAKLGTKGLSKAIVEVMRQWVNQGGSFTNSSPVNHAEVPQGLVKSTSKNNPRRFAITVSQSDRDSLDILTERRKTSLSFFVRLLIKEALRNRRFLLGDELEELRKSNFEIARIGVNLNQITRRINAGHFVGIERDMIEIKTALIEINKHIEVAKKLLQEQVN